MRFERVEPPAHARNTFRGRQLVWSFVLDEHDGKTRLISRNRFGSPQ
jgi:hypothetical protein